MPYAMHSFGGNMICGKRGGKSFLNATRPNRRNQCPAGSLPCSNYTDAQHTVCYSQSSPRNSNCPITAFEFSKKETKLKNAVTTPFGSSAYFSFSRDENAL